jgi:hypothetical protein
MSSTASILSQGSNLIDQSQASSSSSSAAGPAPSRWQSLYPNALQSVFENLGKLELTLVHRTCRHWNSTLCSVREIIFKSQLLGHLLPGIKEDQLPSNLIKCNPKTKKISYEETYKAISRVKYGVEFFSSIGVRTVEPEGPIPAYLLEKRYLLTHRVEVPEGSTLGLTSQGKLTLGPQNPKDPADLGHYAPAGHRYSQARTKAGRFLEFPNTQPNREFLAANPSLIVGPLNYPMQSPLEQGSPILAFQTNLEIDVPESSPLRVTHEGILTEEAGPNEPGFNGIRTVRFLDTPHNWLTLAAPDPHNSSITKYLNKNAKPVKTSYVHDEIKPIWNTPASAGWIAPAAKLIASEDTYLHAEEEALALEQRPMTFHQNSIHRILTKISGNSDLYTDLTSRTATDIISSRGTTYKAVTYMDAVVGPAAPVRVYLDCYYLRDLVGLAVAWGPAGSP